MGDRANVYVKNGQAHGVWLYTHWNGTGLPETLQNALASKEGRKRWDDEAYLTRIIFNHLQGNDRGETGFGISAGLCDNEHPVLIVDCSAQTVELGKAPEFEKKFDPPKPTGAKWSFEEFTKLPTINWAVLTGEEEEQ